MKRSTQPVWMAQLGRRAGGLAASVLIVSLFVLSNAATAQGGSTNQAGLVIQFSDGSVYTACVDLGAEGQATGEEVLRASGLATVIDYSSGMGGTVCKIGNEGCNFPAQKCFCQCTMKPGEPCVYWSYFHLLDGQWRYSIQGANSYIVKPGDVEGWAWGPGTFEGAVQPPLIPVEQLCSIGPGATGTPSPLPAASATPASTAPPAPTDTPLPSATRALRATMPPSATSAPPTRSFTPSPQPTTSATPAPVSSAPPTVERAAPAATTPPTRAVPTPVPETRQFPTAANQNTVAATSREMSGGTNNLIFFGALVAALVVGLVVLRIRR
jgi:hypothetical protein